MDTDTIVKTMKAICERIDSLDIPNKDFLKLQVVTVCFNLSQQ